MTPANLINLKSIPNFLAFQYKKYGSTGIQCPPSPGPE